MVVVIHGGSILKIFENLGKQHFFNFENFKKTFFVSPKISKTLYLTTIYNVIYGGSKTKIVEIFGKRYIWWSLYMVVTPCKDFS